MTTDQLLDRILPRTRLKRETTRKMLKLILHELGKEFHLNPYAVTDLLSRYEQKGYLAFTDLGDQSVRQCNHVGAVHVRERNYTRISCHDCGTTYRLLD
mgnify:CR=1 FL=1